MRAYARRCEVVNANGEYVRAVPAALASHMVAQGIAAVHNMNGKVRSIRLLECTATHALRICPPSAPDPFGVRFCVTEKLDTGHVVWRHHPRSLYSWNDM